MVFGIEKWAMYIRKIGKIKITERREPPNREKSERLEKRKITSTLEYWKQTP